MARVWIRSRCWSCLRRPDLDGNGLAQVAQILSKLFVGITTTREQRGQIFGEPLVKQHEVPFGAPIARALQPESSEGLPFFVVAHLRGRHGPSRLSQFSSFVRQ
jgi:hypothetical protein